MVKKNFLKLDLNNQAEVNQLFAYDRKSPIQSSDQMLQDKMVQWTVPDPEWQKSMDEQRWGRNYHGNDPLSFLEKELQQKLLSFGGAEVCMPYIEEDCENILEHGQLWYGDHVIMRRGQPSQCHMNSAYLYHVNSSRNQSDSYRQRITICTGYGLSEDGLWRQHSWCLWRTPRTVKVVETTVKRVLYFGFAMTQEAADEFFFENE